MTSGCEWLVLPLSGECRVESDAGDKVLFLEGRTDPFAGPTDFAYVPRMSRVTVASTHGARLALPHATAERSLPFRRIPAEECVTELRGAGHVLTPGAQLRHPRRAQRGLDHRLSRS